jgi:hypothetical protein
VGSWTVGHFSLRTKSKAFCLDDLLRIVILAARRRCQPGPQRGVGANRGEKVRRLLFYGRPGLSIGWITRPAAEPRLQHLSHHPTIRLLVGTHLKFYISQLVLGADDSDRGS